MKAPLACAMVSREALAEHLRINEITRSEAAADASIYHCQGTEGQSIAIALPGDRGLIVRVPQTAPNTVDRRRGRR